MGLLDRLLKSGTKTLLDHARRTIEREMDQMRRDISAPSASPKRSTTKRKTSTRKRSSGRTTKTPKTVVKDGRWIGAGQRVMVAGFDVGPFVYVGTRLAMGSSRRIEPSLINPTLQAMPGGAIQPISPDPAYATLRPSQRYAYLQWLAGGRRDATAPVAFVTLYLFGLERYIATTLVNRDDPRTAQDEATALRAEIDALLMTYGANPTLTARLRALRSFVDAVLLSVGELIAPDPPPLATIDAERTAVSLALAMMATTGQTVPAPWALRWAILTGVGRTTWAKAPQEMARLFIAIYRERYAGGITLQPRLVQRFRASYEAANPTLTGASVRADEAPDTFGADPARAEIEAIMRAAAQQLAPWLRDLAKADAPPLAKFASVPAAIFDPTHAGLAPLRGWLERTLTQPHGTLISASDLFKQWSPGADSLAKADAADLAALLARLGYGMEPDARLDGGKIAADQPVVIFTSPESLPEARSDAWLRLGLQTRFAAAVATAGSQMTSTELTMITEAIARERTLDTAERRHLYARLILHAAGPDRLTGLKRQIDALPMAERENMAAFLRELALVDNGVSPEEMEALGRIYRLLGLDGDALTSQLHAAMSHSTVSRADITRLDPDRLARTTRETAEVSTLLGDLFEEEEGAPPLPSPPIATADTIGTLDGPHSALLRELRETASLSLAEWSAMAAKHGTMANGAVDTINEYALDTVGETVLDRAGDALNVNVDVYKELVHD